MKQAKSLTQYISGFILSFILVPGFAQNPGEKWMQYIAPEEVGWSSPQLEQAKAYAEEIHSAAFMLIYDGKIGSSMGRAPTSIYVPFSKEKHIDRIVWFLCG